MLLLVNYVDNEISKLNIGDLRIGAIKHGALKIASNCYHIPIGELKEIIRKMDAERGIPTLSCFPCYMNIRYSC